MLSRRKFLKGLGAATVAVPLSQIAVVERLPVLYGDNIHDDTVALQALLDGKPVKLKSDGSVWKQVFKRGHPYVYLPEGLYRITNTLTVKRGLSLIGNGSTLSLTEPGREDISCCILIR